MVVKVQRNIHTGIFRPVNLSRSILVLGSASLRCVHHTVLSMRILCLDRNRCHPHTKKLFPLRQYHRATIFQFLHAETHTREDQLRSQVSQCPRPFPLRLASADRLRQTRPGLQPNATETAATTVGSWNWETVVFLKSEAC
jgi:hypothetical protein